jgi:hypothetical protein
MTPSFEALTCKAGDRMNQDRIIQYKRYAIQGMFGTVLFMIGDWLLDVKPVDNIMIGVVESGWYPRMSGNSS